MFVVLGFEEFVEEFYFYIVFNLGYFFLIRKIRIYIIFDKCNISFFIV